MSNRRPRDGGLAGPRGPGTVGPARAGAVRIARPIRSQGEDVRNGGGGSPNISDLDQQAVSRCVPGKKKAKAGRLIFT